MTYLKRIILAAISVVFVMTPTAVRAQTDPVMVHDRCELVKNILDQQRKRDLVARINLGRSYQNLINQQQALTTRVRNNKMNAEAFEAQGKQVEADIDRFRSGSGVYVQYDDALGALLQIDCVSKPNEFITQLDKTRALRVAVGEQLQRINVSLARYREIVVNLRTELERLNNAVLGDRQ